MFNSIKSLRPKRSNFDLSHEVKLSFNMGRLIPVLCDEIIPGDRFQVKSEVMIRLAPLLAPMMHRVDVYMHYFFVPNRIIWNEFEDFITGGPEGTLEPIHPFISATDLQSAGLHGNGQLADYLGIPPLSAPPSQSINYNALPFRAYQEIYNEYYRDQNVQPPVNYSKTSGDSVGDANEFRLRNRCWEKDYFTSALPFAQRGAPVSVPATVNYSDPNLLFVQGDPASAGRLEYSDTTNPRQLENNSGQKVLLENIEDVGIDINDLRTSNALQKWLEMAARGGSRYIEQIRNFFGVSSSDARLQRPEYLGGGKQNVVISEVLQTSETTTGTPLGEMAGHGVSVGQSNQFRKSFEEHGIIMGIMSVLPRTAYQNGVERMWSRADKFDYFWPQFAHIGEQEILNQEIYYDGVATTNADTFGYQARYAEYKHKQSRVAGDFRDTLNFYHMGRIFSTTPNLSSAFVSAVPTHRTFANTNPDDHKLWSHVYHNVRALRPMPYYGTPKLVP
jgi:hypothetical protein